MTKVLVLGATGRTGGHLVRHLLDEEGVELRLFVRSPEKLDPAWAGRVEVMQGDVLDVPALTSAVSSCDFVAACLAGDALGQAKAILAAVEGQDVKRVAWLTGVGVQAEVPGEAGEMLAGYARRQPEYVEAARLIHEAPTPSLLVRAPLLTDDPESPYVLHHPGQDMPGDRVSRQTIARFIADAALGRVPMQDNESLGVFDAAC